MLRHFSMDGSVYNITEQGARSLMNKISKNWRTNETPHGLLWVSVVDWDLTSSPENFDGENHRNRYASLFFDFDIYGDCFLGRIMPSASMTI
jgi:hypothetical protein